MMVSKSKRSTRWIWPRNWTWVQKATQRDTSTKRLYVVSHRGSTVCSQLTSRCTWMASSLLPTWLLTGISGKDTKVKKTFLFLLEAIRRHGGNYLHMYIQLHFSRPARKWVRFYLKLVPRAQSCKINELICWPFECARNQNLLIEGAIFFFFFLPLCASPGLWVGTDAAGVTKQGPVVRLPGAFGFAELSFFGRVFFVGY